MKNAFAMKVLVEYLGSHEPLASALKIDTWRVLFEVAQTSFSLLSYLGVSASIYCKQCGI